MSNTITFSSLEALMVRKNLIKLVRHCNMLNPMPTENSPEYRFLNPLLSDEIVDCALKMKLNESLHADIICIFLCRLKSFPQLKSPKFPLRR